MKRCSGTQLMLSVCLITTIMATSSVVGQSTSTSALAVTVPRLIQFSGIARDANGKPLAGTIGITFLLYQDQQGGGPLWMETQNVQPDSKGHYSVQLGAAKPDGLPTDVFTSGEARWLGVQITDQAEQPRVLLLAVPYALKAADASTVGGLPPSAFVRINPEGSTAGGGNPSPKNALSKSLAQGEQPQALKTVKTNGGTTNFVPLWTNSTTVANSTLFQSASGQIGLNTTSPTAALDVNGTGAFRDTLTLFPKGSDPALALQGTTFAVSAIGGVTGVTGFFRSSNNGTIFQATQTSNTSGIALGGVAEGTSGIGVVGSGVTGVEGIGLTPANSIGVTGSGNLYGVTGATSSANSSSAGVFGNATASSGGAAGVMGTSSSGDGVFGGSTATSGTTYGVIGINNNSSGVSAGVEGQSFASSGTTWGLVGASKSPHGIGAVALGVSESNTGFGLIGCCPVGVWGDTGSNASGAAGLVGTADDARAIYLQNNSPSGVPTAFMFQSAAGKLALVAGGGVGACTVDTNGSLVCNGSKSAAVPVENGKRQVALYAVEAPQNWFEDFGSGRLAGGAASVALEPTFAQTVNTASDYHVFLTPRGECEGLYIANATANGFEVRELRRGHSDVVFDYRIVALRRGYENVRLEDKTEMMAKVKQSMPKQLTLPREPVLPAMGPKLTETMSAVSANRAVIAPAEPAIGGASSASNQ